MAAHHIAEIRKVQPVGPYRIGGYCFGGIVAFEMAQQLTDAGEQIERLVLVDSSLRNAPFARLRWLIDTLIPLADGGPKLARRSQWLVRAGAVRQMSPARRREWVLRNTLALLPWRAKAARTARMSAFATAKRDEIWRRPATDIISFEARGSSAYVPRPYAGAIDAIFAIERSAGDVDFAATMGTELDSAATGAVKRGWHRVTDNVRVRTIQAPHVGLITSHIDQLAAHLRACLDLSASR
jgi:thioesterase domain-containing protein